MLRSKTTAIMIHHSGGWASDRSDGRALFSMATDPAHLRQRGIKTPAEYHAIIARNGKVWLTVPHNTVLGHCGTDVYNLVTYAVCFEGDMNKQSLTVAQWNAGIRHIVQMMNLYKLRVPSLPQEETVIGHKHVMATDCPGDRLNIDSLRQAIERAQTYPPKTIYMLIGSTAGKYIPDFVNATPVPIIYAKAPFISGGQAWITLDVAKQLNMKSLKMLANQNGNIPIRALENYKYTIFWNTKTKGLTLRR